MDIIVCSRSVALSDELPERASLTPGFLNEPPVWGAAVIPRNGDYGRKAAERLEVAVSRLPAFALALAKADAGRWQRFGSLCPKADLEGAGRCARSVTTRKSSTLDVGPRRSTQNPEKEAR
jgi:hypothetical protein